MGMRAVKGFTLIEILIAVAIVSILAAIAYPSYQDSVRKSRRADARSVLLEASQFMERRYTQNLQAGYSSVNQAALDAAGFGKSPKDGTTTYYTIALAAAQNNFTLTATPQGAQATLDAVAKGGCGFLSLTNAGVKGAGKTPADDCWR